MNPSTRTLLRSPDFRCLWATGFVTGTVRWLEVLAIGLYTFAETGSPLLVSLMLFARSAPAMFVGSVTGVLASRVGRRTLLRVGLVSMVATSAILLALAWTGHLTLWHIATGAVVNGIVWTFEHPVRRTLIGDIATSERLASAMSLDTLSFNSTRFAGPLLGGSVYAWLGLTGVYTVSLAASVIALLLLSIVRAAGLPRPSANVSIVENLRDGLRYARDNAIVRGILFVTVLTNFFGFSYATMVPVMASDVLQLNAVQTGVLQSVEGLGAVTSAALLAFATLRYNQARLFTLGAAGVLIALIVFALSSNTTLSGISLFAAGGALAAFGAMQSTVLMSRSDPLQRERVMGLLVVCIGAQPFGVLCLGLLAQRFGAPTGLAIMTVTGVLLLATLAFSQRALLGAPVSRGTDQS